MTDELRIKLERIAAYCDSNGFDGVHFGSRANFSWLSCGGNATVERSVQGAVADFIVLKDRRYVVASEIERYRIMDEELGADSGFELVSYPWESTCKERAIAGVTAGRRIASDIGTFGFELRSEELAELRYSLTPQEIERVRLHGKETAQDFENICRALQPGVTAAETAALVAAAALRRGADAPVILIAFDDRLPKYRHPTPKGGVLKKRALVAGCIEKGGLIVSLSRMVSFGEPDDDFKRRYDACAQAYAAAMGSTSTGRRGAEIYSALCSAYTRSGYAEEWLFHHQGGALGYACRDYVVDQHCSAAVQDRQLFSWNPTVRGTKIEDTVLHVAGALETVTRSTSWPYRRDSRISGDISCPDYLVL